MIFYFKPYFRAVCDFVLHVTVLFQLHVLKSKQYYVVYYIYERHVIPVILRWLAEKIFLSGKSANAACLNGCGSIFPI